MERAAHRRRRRVNHKGFSAAPRGVPLVNAAARPLGLSARFNFGGFEVLRKFHYRSPACMCLLEKKGTPGPNGTGRWKYSRKRERGGKRTACASEPPRRTHHRSRRIPATPVHNVSLCETSPYLTAALPCFCFSRVRWSRSDSYFSMSEMTRSVTTMR